MSDLDTLTGKAIVSGLCSIIPDGMTMTLSGYSKDSSCTTTIAGTALSNMITVNGASGSAFKNSALSGLLINSIAGRTIGEITGNELTSINVENFKISTISSALSTAPKNFMQYTKCSGGNILTNTASTICQCVIGVSATQYPPFTGAIASVECNALCPRTVSGTPWATGGVCKKASAYGDTECSGTTTYEYFSRPAIPDPSNPPCTDATMNTCLCYRTKTLSYNAAALLCN